MYTRTRTSNLASSMRFSFFFAAHISIAVPCTYACASTHSKTQYARSISTYIYIYALLVYACVCYTFSLIAYIPILIVWLKGICSRTYQRLMYVHKERHRARVLSMCRLHVYPAHTLSLSHTHTHIYIIKRAPSFSGGVSHCLSTAAEI